ncbi:cohesin subunit [Coprinopsis cinerea okayama7|uniref:Cohesin subunit n=1 Tax=Coprinopsis cinerea (strain Okayama-7 / 130 / ATCC MYA-4618 / FGSC 9003) TaxID=240176 RepID=A8NZN7_COPC7|nr:cohesin subunit [Coprinopsis cinerea okayama7\|eukprot:XP_001837712.2 cohesin subunit [Coprinopsis cinerea okayama7\
MSDTAADTPGPRRSQRERKAVKAFVSTPSTSTRKRKRRDEDAEGEETAATEPEDEPVDEDDADDEEEGDDDDVESKPKRKPGRKPKAKGSPKAKAPTAPKKPREPKTTTLKALKTTTRARRKPKEGEEAYDADQVAKDTRIASDNPLFNAIMNPAAALQSTVEDFLESLTQSPEAAQAELINLFLRSCGCNDTVSPADAVDYDGVLDNLDNITEALKQDNSPTYPLTSRLPIFKKFRRSLSEFIERLIKSAAELESLYSTDLMSTLQTWIVAMSSSQIRSFRHTATVVALEVETALCEVAAAVEKEAQVVGRQREGEKKRKGAGKGASARDKELQSKAQEIRERRKHLAEYLKEFVDGVFVHRYRDLDPNIRAECVKAIGLWFTKYPGHFLDGAYLRYVGWVLSDANTQVRLEAVRSLSGVYGQNDYIGSLNHFTERFKPRLLEMATSDTELSVRVAVIQVLGAIDGHSLLEEPERERLCLLIYDEEARVRKAVSKFVHNVWEESVEEILVGKSKPTEVDQTRVGIKALAALLVKWSQALENVEGNEEDSEDGVDEVASRTSGRGRRKEIWGLLGNTDQRGRTALAVEALWEDVDCVREWEEILNLLLLDHSTTQTNGNSSRVNGHVRETDSRVDDMWRLEEVEETVLLEVLVASVRRLKAEAAAAKKVTDEENLLNDITRAFMKALPRLFIKYQADPYRIAEVLIIPPLLNLELYLEMRMIAAYSNLWDDVIKQFMSHSSMAVLSNAMSAITHFMATTSLSNTNSTKILELEDELSSALHDAVAGREEIEVASFNEDEVLALAAICTRVSVLTGARNMSAWIDEDEGGKQSSAWNIISAIADRGRLGYKEEETMVEQALNVLTLHMYWKAKGLLVATDPNAEENPYKEVLQEQRESLIDKLKEYAVGNQSNTVDGVKRAAFKHLLNLHILFTPDQPPLPDGSPSPLSTVGLMLDDEMQYRCTGYIQAEIERYAEYLQEVEGVQQSEGGSEQGENSDGGEGSPEKTTSAKGKQKANKPQDEDQGTGEVNSREVLEHEYLFVDVLTTFLRAIRTGAINLKHGAIFLAHYGRLGSSVDSCAKTIVKWLAREEGEIIVEIATRSLRDAFTLVLDGIVPDEAEAVQLAKLLSQSFVLRGSQLTVLRRLDPQHIVAIHTNLLNWIAKRMSVYENNKNKKGMKTALSFFRVLVALATGLQSGDALKIKAHMDQVFEQSKIEVPPTAKDWEPQRSYERRLDNLMTKEKGGVKRKGRKGKGGAETDVQSEEESEVENLLIQEPPTKPKPRPRSKRVTRSNPVVEEEPEPEPEPEPPASREPSLAPSDVAMEKGSQVDEPESSNGVQESIAISTTARRRPADSQVDTEAFKTN